MRCGFLFSKSGMLFVIIGLWFFCGLFFRFYNFKLEKFKCQTYTSHVRPCGLRGLCGLRGMLLSHTLQNYMIIKFCTFWSKTKPSVSLHVYDVVMTKKWGHSRAQSLSSIKVHAKCFASLLPHSKISIIAAHHLHSAIKSEKNVQFGYVTLFND